MIWFIRQVGKIILSGIDYMYKTQSVLDYTYFVYYNIYVNKN